MLLFMAIALPSVIFAALQSLEQQDSAFLLEALVKRLFSWSSVLRSSVLIEGNWTESPHTTANCSLSFHYGIVSRSNVAIQHSSSGLSSIY